MYPAGTRGLRTGEAGPARMGRPGEPTGEGVGPADENKGDGAGEYVGEPTAVDGGGGEGARAEKAGTINVMS